MKEHQNTPRFNDLHRVLEYCSEVERKSEGRNCIFTTLQRICINQERGAIYSQQSAQKREITANEVRTYQVPPHIEEKIKQLLKQ